MKDIKSYENKYAVDKEGNVWSYPNRFHKDITKLKPRVRQKGYQSVSLSKNGRLKSILFTGWLLILIMALMMD